jgi:hypothetical protein
MPATHDYQASRRSREYRLESASGIDAPRQSEAAELDNGRRPDLGNAPSGLEDQPLHPPNWTHQKACPLGVADNVASVYPAGTTAAAGDASSTLPFAAPILFRLASHRRCRRVLDLDPMI